MNAVVVGAGVFGASTARALARRGWAVTLIEQYTPGNVRSASGGDTRLLRMAHGGEDWYAQLAWSARTQWLELQEQTGTRIWEPNGVAWFAQHEDGFERESLASLQRLGIPAEWLSPGDARGLYPSLNVADLAGVLFEPAGGVLHARRATQLLVEDAQRSGARLEHAHATPSDPPQADVVVWAGGAWLPQLFPGEVELAVTRQEVFFFGGDAAWSGTPGFCDYEGPFYGHGEVAGLGVKVARNSPGLEIEPDAIDRIPSEAGRRDALQYAAHRFPALAETPIVGGRVCQYVSTIDTHFIVARHPERPSWWIVGGGSGHGFKHGPALGDYVADCVEGKREPEPFHALGPRTGDAGLRTAADAS